jgi:hypothetical protein
MLQRAMENDQPWTWKRHVPAKYLLTFNRQHGAISQKVELLISWMPFVLYPVVVTVLCGVVQHLGHGTQWPVTSPEVINFEILGSLDGVY